MRNFIQPGDSLAASIPYATGVNSGQARQPCRPTASSLGSLTCPATR
jgi:hypothetical protein